MFSRVLVANRGEIALRVIRACREMGLETVAVYSSADAKASYLRYADESICIGPPQSAKSYLSIPAILAAAEIANVDAIHPGYGFLSENAHFAQLCRDSNISFIGPRSEAIRTMGDKAAARRVAEKAGVPVVPGSKGKVTGEDDALKVAREIGYPVLVKAAAGGGGRGMRVAHNDMSLRAAIQAAQTEAQAAFGDASVYLERYLDRPRHVEVQILADEHGNVVHLFERDCSVQRRHQKMIEESPSPALPKQVRKKMHAAAVKLMKTAGYSNAGTVEFLVDRDNSFYFIEVNARIQVEHPVTELVTGIDLVKEQIRVAAGEKLGYGQDDIEFRGAAIEVRVNAEDPANGFRASPGRIVEWSPPGGPGVRLDSHATPGYVVPPNYDSLVGKLIVHKPDRRTALKALDRCLDEFVVSGIATTIPFFRRVLRHAAFVSGHYDTGVVEDILSGTE
ncbi:MAG: Biotin carboxylase [Planctomycetes bacterium]|nr:Biotin carboxylase [Planctomycetota bacterium]